MREDNISGDEKKSSGKQLPGKVNFPPILRGGADFHLAKPEVLCFSTRARVKGWEG